MTDSPFGRIPVTRHGMTLIELLVAIGIVGILAAIAIPRYMSSRERAYVAVMQADLNQLRISQELHSRSATRAYADDISELASFQPSPEVSISLIDRGETEWAAEASHENTDRVCTYESVVGVITCDPELDADDSPPEDDAGSDGEDPADEDDDGNGDQSDEGDGGWFWK